MLWCCKVLSSSSNLPPSYLQFLLTMLIISPAQLSWSSSVLWFLSLLSHHQRWLSGCFNLKIFLGQFNLELRWKEHLFVQYLVQHVCRGKTQNFPHIPDSWNDLLIRSCELICTVVDTDNGVYRRPDKMITCWGTDNRSSVHHERWSHLCDLDRIQGSIHVIHCNPRCWWPLLWSLDTKCAKITRHQHIKWRKWISMTHNFSF